MLFDLVVWIFGFCWVWVAFCWLGMVYGGFSDLIFKTLVLQTSGDSWPCLAKLSDVLVGVSSLLFWRCCFLFR